MMTVTRGQTGVLAAYDKAKDIRRRAEFARRELPRANRLLENRRELLRLGRGNSARTQAQLEENFRVAMRLVLQLKADIEAEAEL